ncbi:MAG: hypothetical protein ACYTFM_11740 [Planctomycetota bacterium]|jgi:capsular polysaccharide biosynthesis protein
MRLRNKKVLGTGADGLIGSHPIKPMLRHNVILAGAMGVLLMLILAFFIEYISKKSENLVETLNCIVSLNLEFTYA